VIASATLPPPSGAPHGARPNPARPTQSRFAVP